MYLKIILILIILINIYTASSFQEPFTYNFSSLCKKYPSYCKDIKIDNQNHLIYKNGKQASYKDINDPTKAYNCTNKDITLDILKKNNIPISTHYIWDKTINTNKNIENINQFLKFPLVVKPTNGEKGINVTTDIDNNRSLIENVNKLLTKNNNILIEEQLNGNDYRIIVFKDEVINVLHRKRPFVIGDGNSTLDALIREHKYTKHMTHNVDDNLLLKQNVKKDDIIPYNKKIILSNVRNFHNGGNVEIVPLNIVHPENLEMFKKINKLLEQNMTGIDFISNNLSLPFYQEGAIIEVNAAPGSGFQHVPDGPSKQKYLDKIIDKLF